MLEARYASPEMAELFSPQRRAKVWRQLWVELARAQKDLGMTITAEQITELEAKIDSADLDAIKEHERNLRHDVMAHIAHYGDQCPGAKGILHLGATSTYVTDNGDLILMREALRLIEAKLVRTLMHLRDFCVAYRNLPCLGYTHLQPAQPTTLGKRAALWAQDFAHDLRQIKASDLPFLGVKGATGTQASFAQLVGDRAEELEKRVAAAFGFDRLVSVAGQTYPRKIDELRMAMLAGIATSASKMATDMRLLAHLQEVEEPFEKRQVGSSAMPHKRNPILSERICGLSRYVLNSAQNAGQTAAVQWLERSLDDSANRRLAIPQTFLAVDGILNLAMHLTESPVVRPHVMERRLAAELPYLAMERLLMAGVKAGADRQQLHERLRHHAQEARGHTLQTGEPCDLLQQIQTDPEVPIDQVELKPEEFIGRAPQQVDAFVAELDELLGVYTSWELPAPTVEW